MTLSTKLLLQRLVHGLKETGEGIEPSSSELESEALPLDEPVLSLGGWTRTSI